MSANILEKDLTKLFGLDEMSAPDRDSFLENVGNLILEGVMTRLAADRDEQELEALHGLIMSAADSEDLLRRLEKNYPEVNELFQEEVERFRKEAIEVLAARET